MITIETNNENTMKAYEFLSAHKGEMFTLKQIAEALGVSTAKILGGLTSLKNKGALAQDEVESGEKVYKAYYVTDEEVEFHSVEKKNISDKAVQVLQYLQNGGEGQTHTEIAEAMGATSGSSITGVLNGLVKKNLIVREEQEITMGEEVKTQKVINLTEEGRKYQF